MYPLTPLPGWMWGTQFSTIPLWPPTPIFYYSIVTPNPHPLTCSNWIKSLLLLLFLKGTVICKATFFNVSIFHSVMMLSKLFVPASLLQFEIKQVVLDKFESIVDFGRNGHVTSKTKFLQWKNENTVLVVHFYLALCTFDILTCLIYVEFIARQCLKRHIDPSNYFGITH